MSDVYKATKNKIVANTQNKGDVYKATKNKKINPTIYSENKAEEKAKNIVSKSDAFSQGTLTPSNMQSAAVKKLKDTQTAEKLKTTIPSKSYDANYVEELRLRDEMKKAKKNYEETKANDDRNILVKFLQMGSDLSPVYYAQTQYNKAKKEYENFKAINYYSKLPNGEAKTTNKTKKNNDSYYLGDASVDWRHEYINNFGNFQSSYVSLGKGRENYSKYAFMNEREKGIYNYLYNIDTAKAEEFLKFLDEDLQKRLTEENVKSAYDFAGKNAGTAVLASVASIGTNLASAAEQGKNIFNYATTGEISENSATKITNALRSGVTDNVDVEIGNWDAFDFVYNTVMSGADSLAVAPMGAVGAITLGLSAAGSTTNDILQRGGDSSQAFWGGVAAGVFEGFFEKFSIGQLNAMKEGAVTGFKDYALNLVKSMGVNFSEEAATEVANILYDYAMNGGISNYSIMVQEFIDNGDSPEVAKKKAATKLGLQVLEAGASGALMGAWFASIASASSYKNTSSIGKVIAANETESEIINAALSMDGNSQSYKLVTEIQQSGKMSTTKIGGLAVQVMADVSTQKGTAIQTAVGERAQELGVDYKITQKLTSYLTEVATNGKIETANAEDIGKNTKAQQIITEIKNSEAWAESMNAQLSSLEKTEAIVRSAITFNTDKNSSAAVEDITEPTLTEAETQLVNTPDAELTPEQRIEKQGIEERLQTADNDIQGLGVQQTAEIGKAENSNIEILSVRKKSKQRRHTTAKEQTFIKRIADKLGVKVEFEHITAELLRSYGYEFNDGDILPDGYYDRDTKTVHIGYTVYNPVAFIFKHELTHFGEGTAQYKKFVEAVRSSKAFKNWLNENLKKKKIYNAKQLDITRLEEIYLSDIAKIRGYTLNENGELNEPDRQELMCEMIADFVGECIFTSDTSMLKRMMSELDEKERNVVIKHIRDFFSYLLRKLQGEKQLTFEIMELEKEFNKVLAEADRAKKETPTESDGGLQFSISDEFVIDLSNNNDLSRRIGENKGTEKYKIIQEYIFENIGEQPIVLSDGKKAIVDKSDARHISQNAGSRKRAQISEINKIIQKAQLVAEEKSTKERKFDYFYYYEAYVRFGENTYPIYINVGRARNDGKYHIYDITQKLRDTAHRINGVGRPVGNALESDISNNSITENPPTVNNNYTQESGNNSKSKLKFSFASVRDTALIEEAEALEKQLQKSNYSPEKIRNEIWLEKGVMRDTGGIWVYEIEDRSMKFFPFGNARKSNTSNNDGSVYKKGQLSDFIKHPKLFKAFPMLKSYNFEICDLENGAKGEFDYKTNTIRISANEVLKANKKLEALGGKMPRSAYDNPYREVNGIIIHEIQHALQMLEDREQGSSVEYWNLRFKRDGSLPVNPKTGEELTPEEAYWLTKGEYEAREAQNRVPISPKYRIPSIPDLGHGKTVSARDTVTENLKFSIPSDAEYMSAVKMGNTAQLQEMVDNAAASNGYTERLYHQTGAEFTEFNTENQAAGKFDWQLPTGMFLKPSDNDIGLKGKMQMELFAKISNPLQFKNRSEAQEFWSKRIPGYKKAVQTVEEIDNEYRKKDNDAIMDLQSFMRQWKKENPDADKRDIYSDPKYQKLADKESAIMDEWELKSDKASIEAKKLINDFIANSEYDGVVIDRDDDGKNRHTKSYIVFDSSQLKSGAPVTYDNNGEVISLSERFNKDKRDIRFSMPKESTILLNMFESGEISKSEYEIEMEKYWERTLSHLKDKNIRYSRKLSYRKRVIKRKNEQLKKQNEELKRYNETVTPYGTLSFSKNWQATKQVLSRIKTRFDYNSDKRHIPEELKEYTNKLLTSFYRDDPMPFSSENLLVMKGLYEKFAGSEEIAEQVGYDPEIAVVLGELSESIDGRTIKDLDFDELLCIRQVTENLWHMIQGKEEVFLNGKKQEIKYVGEQTLRELSLLKSKRGNFVTKAYNKVIFDNMLPIYFFERLGGTFEKLFETLLDGEDNNQINVDNDKTFISNTRDKYNYYEWGTDNLTPITTEHGKSVSLTVEQGMLLYATYKREKLQQKDRTEHILEGGITVPKSQTTLTEFKKKLQSNSEKGLQKLFYALTDELNESAVKVTETDVENIINQLTDEQKAYADETVKYLSENKAALGNQTSMEFFGYCKYNDGYYIPFCSAKNYLNVQIGTIDGNHPSLKHSSFTHKLSKGAKTPLVMGDFSEVCADHMHKMSRYNASAVTLDAMLKILNYKNDSGKTVASILADVYGNEALKYFKDFLDKMNGSLDKEDGDSIMNYLVGAYRKNAVSASLSVVVQQPTSLPRAMIEIAPKYFVGRSPKSDYEEMLTYAPVAAMKERGRVDIGTGTATVKWMLNRTPETFGEKVKAFVDVKDSSYRDDKFMRLAAKGDEWTWRQIWSAVKREIADKTDLEEETPEFFEACNKRFRYVVNKTQVYDSPVSKSKIMSSKSWFAKSVTAFAAEPTVWLNVLANINKKNAVRTISIFLVSGALNAAFKSLVTAARDDEEEETYFEKWLDDFKEAFIDNINPLSLIPVARDFVSLQKGFDVERPDMSAITDVIDAYNALGSEKKSTYRKIEDLAGALATFLGLPVKNVMRDARAAYNLCNDVFINDKIDRKINKEVEGYIDELSSNKTFNSFKDEDKEKLEGKIADTVRKLYEFQADQKQYDEFDELYELLRKSKTLYQTRRKEMLEAGYKEREITDGVEMARVAYMKSIGINVSDYLLYKMATNEDYGNIDGGGITEPERKKAVREMDIDEKIKKYFLNKHK